MTDKVIEDLKQLKHCITKPCDITCSYYNAEDMICPCSYDVSSDVTIDNAIQTIRELQSKSEEVCEWYKADEEGYSNCHYDYDETIPDFFKYCPYCGRKIKVVE